MSKQERENLGARRVADADAGGGTDEHGPGVGVLDVGLSVRYLSGRDGGWGTERDPGLIGVTSSEP